MIKHPVTVADYRLLAKRRLPKGLFDYIDGGSYEEVTLAANREDLIRMRFRQRVLRDVSQRDTASTLFGSPLRMPLVLAPVGLAGAMARRAEVLAAKEAEKAGIPFCLSTVSVCSIEEVRAATTAPFWFQLYMMRDRGFVAELLGRAQAAGCSALVVTVDVALLGIRYRDWRNGMRAGAMTSQKLLNTLRILARPRWLADVALQGKPLVFGNLTTAVPQAKSIEAFSPWLAEQLDSGVTWEDISWLRSIWKGPLIVKGILDVEDAAMAAKMGADGIVVSNHGGRQLDSAPSTISMLKPIVDQVGGAMTIIMDGGVRSGQDMAKVLACGAQAAMAGRAWILPLAARGEAGLSATLATMRQELEITMALLGVTQIKDLTRAVLVDEAGSVKG